MAHSPDTRERIGRGRKRANDRRKAQNRVLGRHVAAALRQDFDGPVVSMAKARTEDVAEMIADMGGDEHVSAMERAALHGWFMATVAADSVFLRFVQEQGDSSGLSVLATLLNTARANLVAVGLPKRVIEKTLDLEDYLRERREAAQVAAGATKGEGEEEC